MTAETNEAPIYENERVIEFKVEVDGIPLDLPKDHSLYGRIVFTDKAKAAGLRGEVDALLYEMAGYLEREGRSEVLDGVPLGPDNHDNYLGLLDAVTKAVES